MINSISIKELLPFINQVNLIDIRSVEKFNDNHIPNALNINPDQLLREPSKYLDMNKKYYIYCQKGLTSLQIVQLLNLKGYKTINIKGGYESWLLEK